MHPLAIVRQLINEMLEDDVEARIEARAEEPELRSVEEYVDAKMADNDNVFDFVDLQAISRNVVKRIGHKAAEPDPATVKRVKADLESYGLQFVPRSVERHVRGHLSPAHGRHPCAGTGGGGTGFGSDFSGGTFTSFGGGPGAVGGGYVWDPTDKKNLSMGVT